MQALLHYRLLLEAGVGGLRKGVRVTRGIWQRQDKTEAQEKSQLDLSSKSNCVALGKLLSL